MAEYQAKKNLRYGSSSLTICFARLLRFLTAPKEKSFENCVCEGDDPSLLQLALFLC